MKNAKEYLKTYWYFESSKIRTKINGLLYYLRKIPLIGPKIPETIYKNYELKDILFALGVIGSLLLKFSLKVMWLGVPLLIASFNPLVVSGSVFEEALVYWVFLVPLGMNFYEGFYQMLESKELDYVDHYFLSRKRYFRSQMSVKTVCNALAYLPVFTAFGIGLQTVFLPLNLILVYLSSAFMWYLVGRLLIDFSQLLRGILAFSYLIILLGSMYISTKIDGNGLILEALSSFIVTIILSLLVFISAKSLFNYENEELYFNKVIEKSINLIDKSQLAASSTNTYLGEGIKMQKALKLDGNQYLNLHGSQYLNALLFSRYGKTLKKELLIKVVGIILAGLAIIVLTYVRGGMQLAEKQLIGFLPILFFVMYLLTFGKKIVQLVFINCDSSMLFYPFYREPKTILAGFFFRFWKTLLYNSSLSLAIFSMFSLFSVLNPEILSGKFFLILGFLLFSLAFLFSFHELFVYYLLQPFTSDLEVVNPIYKLISGALYWVGYINLRTTSTGFNYVLLISMACLLYVIVGVIVIALIAPKTFRLKG